MTKEQFEDIKSRLTKWREARGLSVEGQKANFKANYAKELVEFFEAERDGNEYEMIDALCDMIVTAINSGLGFLGIDDESEKKYTTWFRVIYLSSGAENDISSLVVELVKRGYDPYLCLLETIKELETRTGSWNKKEGKWCKDLGAYTIEEAIKIAERETNRGIVEFGNSFGDGYFGFTNVKIKKWYKADYAKCKICG